MTRTLIMESNKFYNAIIFFIQNQQDSLRMNIFKITSIGLFLIIIGSSIFAQNKSLRTCCNINNDSLFCLAVYTIKDSSVKVIFDYAIEMSNNLKYSKDPLLSPYFSFSWNNEFDKPKSALIMAHQDGNYPFLLNFLYGFSYDGIVIYKENFFLIGKYINKEELTNFTLNLFNKTNDFYLYGKKNDEVETYWCTSFQWEGFSIYYDYDSNTNSFKIKKEDICIKE